MHVSTRAIRKGCPTLPLSAVMKVRTLDINTAAIDLHGLVA
jgi:hypothetical protein